MNLIPYEKLSDKLGRSYSKSQLWRLERKGLFPKRAPLTPGGHNLWVEDEIDAFIAERIAARPDRPPEKNPELSRRGRKAAEVRARNRKRKRKARR